MKIKIFFPSLEEIELRTMKSSFVLSLMAAVPIVLACDSCYGPQDAVVHTRNVPRMQPGVESATTGPKSALEWGQINFMHTVSRSRRSGFI